MLTPAGLSSRLREIAREQVLSALPRLELEAATTRLELAAFRTGRVVDLIDTSRAIDDYVGSLRTMSELLVTLGLSSDALIGRLALAASSLSQEMELARLADASDSLVRVDVLKDVDLDAVHSAVAECLAACDQQLKDLENAPAPTP